MWKISLTSSLPSEPIVVALSVISHTPARTPVGEEPITVSASVSERDLPVGRAPVVSVSVKKGERGVAKAEVEAVVVLPSGGERRWVLYDGGASEFEQVS